LNNYKIKVIIKFSDQLSSNNGYLTLASYQGFSHLYHYILNLYLIKLETNLESSYING